MIKEQKITGNIQPPNKDLEILKQNFPNCFDKKGEFDFEKFKKQLSKNEINFSKESYGMDWLGKSYARLLATDETTTLLKEDEIFNQKEENKSSENLLIKGDNLEVLKHLSNAYYEKIKMIYIDPPYNTGSDGFVYADDRKFTVEELQELAGVNEERAKRILDFTQSKSNSHSAWLTFMYPRLYIAKQLLKEDGAIFISIDDNEVAQLRLLMDEVFGEENFVGELIRQSKIGGGSDSKFLVKEHEYCLCFSKNINHLNEFYVPYDINYLKRYKEKDSKGKYFWDTLARGGLKNPIKFEVEAPDGTKLIDNWNRAKSTFYRDLKEGEIKFKKKKDNNWNVYFKQRINPNGKKPRSLTSELGSTIDGKNDIKNLFENDKTFSYPKPKKLIQFLADILNTKNEIILDFFAGSGTTADAVMQLNLEDDGKRKFILAQLPELIDPKSNKTAYEFVKNELKIETPTIFEITKERLIRASKKIIEQNIDKPAKSEKLKCKGCDENGDHCNTCKGEYTVKIEATKKKDLSNQDLGFKIFETMPIWEDYNFDSEELEKQTNLFDENKLTKKDIKALLVTWKTYDGVSLSQSLQDIDLTDYKANYSNGKLYLMDKGFKTKNLKILLEKIDSDKDFNPTTIIAFGYHFESKNLREISENIKSYANKKSIDIDFITRY